MYAPTKSVVDIVEGYGKYLVTTDLVETYINGLYRALFIYEEHIRLSNYIRKISAYRSYIWPSEDSLLVPTELKTRAEDRQSF